MSRRAFVAVLLLLTAIALLLRLPSLGARPMHADEAVHAFKFRDLWEHGDYRYDPDEFHGPTLYYATLPIMRLAGRRDFADTRDADYRIAPALFGAGMVLLLLLVSDGLGQPATLVAAALIALSPAFVFYSRYFIQEVLLAFFTLAALGCGWRYTRKPTVGWAIAVGVCVGAMIATKETAVFAIVAAVAAVTAVALSHPPGPPLSQAKEGGVWSRYRRFYWGIGSSSGFRFRHPLFRLRERGPGGERMRHCVLAIAVTLLVAYFLLSDHFAHPAAGIDYLRSFLPWGERGGSTQMHRHPWSYYLSLLLWMQRRSGGPVFSEAFIVLLAIVGGIAAFSRRPDLPAGANRSFVGFVAIYTLLLTIVYCAIPYKTPWCVLSFLTGMALLAGFGAVAIVRRTPGRVGKAIVVSVLTVGCGMLGYDAYLASNVYYADGQNPYAYAPTAPEVITLSNRITDLAQASPAKDRLVVKVFSVDGYYWPLPYYLRRFPNVGYWVGVPQDCDAPVVIASPELDDELTRRLGATHLMTGYYGLRAGVLVELWVRLDLWQGYLKTRHW